MLIDLDYREFEVPGFASAKVDVRPLSVEAYQACLRVVTRTMGDENWTDNGKRAMSLVVDAETLAVAKQVLPLHARNLVGISVREKGETRQAAVEDLTDRAPLFGVGLTILAHLISISGLTEQESGN